MRTLRNTLQIAGIEWLKFRKLTFLWLILTIPFFVPVILLIIRLKLAPETTAIATETPWFSFILSSTNLFSFLLLPLAVILLASQVMQLEFQSGSWKQLFLLPFPKRDIIFGKFAFLLFTLVALYLVFFLSVPLIGSLLGWLKPQFGFLNYPFPWEHMLIVIGQSYCAVLGLLSIQFLLAWLFSNYTYPIVAGIVTTVVFSTVALGWSKNIYIPHTFPTLHTYMLREQLNPPFWFGVPAFYVVSFAAIVLCLSLVNLNLRFRRSPF